MWATRREAGLEGRGYKLDGCARRKPPLKLAYARLNGAPGETTALTVKTKRTRRLSCCISKVRNLSPIGCAAVVKDTGRVGGPYFPSFGNVGPKPYSQPDSWPVIFLSANGACRVKWVRFAPAAASRLLHHLPESGKTGPKIALAIKSPPGQFATSLRRERPIR